MPPIGAKGSSYCRSQHESKCISTDNKTNLPNMEHKDLLDKECTIIKKLCNKFNKKNNNTNQSMV
jgi:hypothetical protein